MLQKQFTQNLRNLSRGYKGNPNLARPHEVHNYTPEEIQEYIKCADPDTGPVYFSRKYIKIVHPDHGLIPFDLWDFQEDIINKANNNRFIVCKMPRQTGKSTTLIAYFLWYILFHKHVAIAILANKAELARELLGRLQLAYEWLPRWLQQGIVEWNKGSIELANGSKIIAEATSASSIRGRTFNIIMLDEFAHVEAHLAEEFFTSTFPTISSGKTTKVLIVSTPKGMNQFFDIWDKAEQGRNDYIPIEVHWSDVPGRDEQWKETMIRNTSPEQFAQEQECEFLGSTATLISSAVLKRMKWVEPIQQFEDKHLAIYEKPKKGHVYTITCDVSRGQGLDAQAFSVIDVTKIPYVQVARFRDNRMPALTYPNVIFRAGKYYNNAFVLVEINDVGQQVADILHFELGYDNLFKLITKGKQGQQVSAGYKKLIQFGVRTTTPVKRIGCSNIKTLIEGDKLLIHDKMTIYELRTFVVYKESYAAEEGTGAKDDLAMSLVLFGWLVNQRMYKDAIGTDMRKTLELELEETLQEDVPWAGILGIQKKGALPPEATVDIQGDIWVPASNGGDPAWF